MAHAVNNNIKSSFFKKLLEKIELMAGYGIAKDRGDNELADEIRAKLESEYGQGIERFNIKKLGYLRGEIELDLKQKYQSEYKKWEKNKLDINYQFEVERGDGDTIKTRLLHLAAECGFKEVVKALIDNGAKPLLKNSEGKIPLDLAKNSETKLILLEASKKEISSNKTDRKIKMGVSGVGAVSAVGVALYTTNIVAISTASIVAFVCLAAFVYNAYQFREIKEVETKINNIRLEPVVGADTGVTTQP